MMFNKYFWLAFIWHIVQMYFPNTFEIRYLNRAWMMGLYADILLGEVISENRKEETGKNKTNKQKGGEVYPWWIIELLFQWKFELNLSAKTLRNHAESNMILTAWKEQGYFNQGLIQRLIQGILPFCRHGFLHIPGWLHELSSKLPSMAGKESYMERKTYNMPLSHGTIKL